MTNSIPEKLTILVVEDNPSDFGMLQVHMRLAKLGLNHKNNLSEPLLWAKTLADSIGLLRHNTPDAILLDLSLPDSSGLTTVRVMRAAAPDLPIIVLISPNDDYDDLASEALAAGAQDYLIKGQFDHDTLRRAINNAIVRRKLEQKIADHERILNAAIEAVDEAFVLFDNNDHLVFCNDKYRSLYATSADLIVPGVKFEHIIREVAGRGHYLKGVGREEEMVAERLAAHQQDHSRLILKINDNRWLNIIERKTADGYVVGLHVDITELQTAKEAAEAACAAKSRLLDSMILELHTPINKVLKMLELLNETELTRGQKEYVNVARDSTQNLIKQLNEALEFSKIETRDVTSETAPFLVAHAKDKEHIEAAVLDTTAALAMLDGDMSLLLMMLPIVRDQMMVDRLEIASAINEKDTAQVVKIIQRLKGSMAQIGALRVKNACSLLESAADSEDLTSFSNLQKELDTLAQAIAAYLAPQSSQAT